MYTTIQYCLHRSPRVVQSSAIKVICVPVGLVAKRLNSHRRRVRVLLENIRFPLPRSRSGEKNHSRKIEMDSEYKPVVILVYTIILLCLRVYDVFFFFFYRLQTMNRVFFFRPPLPFTRETLLGKSIATPPETSCWRW